MTAKARDTLIAHGVDEEHIHLELFHRLCQTEAPQGDYQSATVTFTLSGQQETFDLVAATRSSKVHCRFAATPLFLHGRRVRHLPGEAA